MSKRVLAGWVPVVLWCALIFALSSIPSLGTGLGAWDLLLRKIAHATEYAILAVLLARALRNTGVVLVVAVMYAISDEIHQTFVPGRAGRPLDVAIDTAGAVLGVLCFRVVSKRRARMPTAPALNAGD